ncbi:hypothetical protein B0H16DRAFT_1661505 [Mycena metata]|uniref:Uncharacterized protein n=1 Tax=Mycena metata TaxID=1033252 RepID=A0AAD7JK75_9AGAR|nr:hypothetical protein B0H16DRAFT_1661505 [Mycena metata]
MGLAFLRCRPRCVLVVAALLTVIFVTVATIHPKLRHIARVNYNYYIGDVGPQDGPPRYTALREWEANLPQHNLSLPFPEGKTGRYVKFANQARQLGWNNCFNEVLMNAHLAYVSGRSYVFQDFVWTREHYQWPAETWVNVNPRTPLNAIVSGPIAGGPFESDDPAPRAISEDWFDAVCPLWSRTYINVRDVKPALVDAPGTEVLATWQKLLRDSPARCIEVTHSRGESFPQTFDLSLFGSPRVLTLWDSFSQSPISRLLDASPIVRAAVDRNSYLFMPRGPRPPHPAPRDPFQRMLAFHLRRGDYEGHCRWLSYINVVFYSWNMFPHLPDRFVSEPDAPGKDERFLERCWPDKERIVKKAADARRDYLAHAQGGQSDATLDVMYLLTNEKSAWIDELKHALAQDGWSISTSMDLVLDVEQTDVSMAVDMEIARRAAVFVGNGWSSFTSNIVYQRLVDKRDPITIRFS